MKLRVLIFLLLLKAGGAAAREGRSVCSQGPFCTCSPQEKRLPFQRGGKGNSQKELSPSQLPSFYLQTSKSEGELSGAEEGSWKAEEKPEVLTNLLKGTRLRAWITKELWVSSGVPQPIQAQITQGEYQKARLLGQAERHPDIEDRVLLSFHTLHFPGRRKKNYTLEAVGMELSGASGLQGKVFSSTHQVLGAALLSNAGQAVTEASIPRQRNRWGEYVEEPSISQLGKKAASGAFSQMTQYFTNQLGKIPGFVQVPSFQVIEVEIQKTPVREKD